MIKPKYEDRQQKNSDIYNRKQWEQNATLYTKEPQKFKLKCIEDHTDSAKSEEEAATMIQATYRGYKVRRKFDEVSKCTN